MTRKKVSTPTLITKGAPSSSATYRSRVLITRWVNSAGHPAEDGSWLVRPHEVWGREGGSSSLPPAPDEHPKAERRHRRNPRSHGDDSQGGGHDGAHELDSPDGRHTREGSKREPAPSEPGAGSRMAPTQCRQAHHAQERLGAKTGQRAARGAPSRRQDHVKPYGAGCGEGHADRVDALRIRRDEPDTKNAVHHRQKQRPHEEAERLCRGRVARAIQEHHELIGPSQPRPHNDHAERRDLAERRPHPG